MKRLPREKPLVREFAAVALGNIGPHAKAAVPTLAQALQDAERRARRTAASTLAAIGARIQQTGACSLRWRGPATTARRLVQGRSDLAERCVPARPVGFLCRSEQGLFQSQRATPAQDAEAGGAAVWRSGPRPSGRRSGPQHRRQGLPPGSRRLPAQASSPVWMARRRIIKDSTHRE
jgi:hypothetical protein